MTILIPMDSDDVQEASIVSLEEVCKWALLNVEEGQLVEVTHYDNREEIEDWIETVVVINQKENVEAFHEEQIMVLVAPMQRSIDDILESYLFRELHELDAPAV